MLAGMNAESDRWLLVHIVPVTNSSLDPARWTCLQSNIELRSKSKKLAGLGWAFAVVGKHLETYQHVEGGACIHFLIAMIVWRG